MMWGFPAFSEAELDYVEAYYRVFYYENTKIPEAGELAREVAIDFIEIGYDYVDLYNEQDVTKTLIVMLIDAIGDDYGVYRTPQEQAEYNTDNSGQYSGIGVAIQRIGDEEPYTYVLIQIQKDSPAEKAGFLPGDILIGAEGLTIEKDGYDAVVAKVRGESGTDVTVTVERNGVLLDLTATREHIEENTVTYEILDGNIGYIVITAFKENTAAQFVEAIDAIETAECVGVVFDLRANGGGLLRSVVDMLSYLVPDGTPISSFTTTSQSSLRAPKYASAADSVYEDTDHVLTIPAVYICNKYTASAAELFCSAIRDYGEMGLIKSCGVGEVSFGKGIMQTGMRLPSGTYLTITTNLYNSPDGENYHGKGVTPDFIIEDLTNTDPLPTAKEKLLGLLATN